MSATPRRILVVLQSTAIGGMETHAVDLAAELTRRGAHVTFALPEQPAFDPLALRARDAAAVVWRLTTDAREGRAAQARAYVSLVRRIRRLRPDVVHLHTGGATGGLGLLLAARLAGVPARVITEHDVPCAHPPCAQRLARAALDRVATAVVAISRRNAALRQARLPVRNPRFAAILNGVPVPDLDEVERHLGRVRVRQELGIPAGAVVVGCLVRLAEGKGLDTLVEAFARLRSPAEGDAPGSTNPPGPILLLVGDGPLRGSIADHCRRLGIDGAVRFAGNQAHPAAYLDAMDVFALAVPAGSGSIALLEAMGRGLPPVITFCGPEEAVIPGETGLGAPPDDPAALTAALDTLIRDPLRRQQIGAAARAHVRRHFSVQRVADDIQAVYAARRGRLPARLRAGGPPTPRPGAGTGSPRSRAPGEGLGRG